MRKDEQIAKLTAFTVALPSSELQDIMSEFTPVIADMIRNDMTYLPHNDLVSATNERRSELKQIDRALIEQKEALAKVQRTIDLAKAEKERTARELDRLRDAVKDLLNFIDHTTQRVR